MVLQKAELPLSSQLLSIIDLVAEETRDGWEVSHASYSLLLKTQQASEMIPKRSQVGVLS